VAINVNFKMAAAAILDFLRSEIWSQFYLRDVVFSLCAKFCANVYSSDQVVAVKVNFNMAAAAILDFFGNWILTPKWLVGYGF